MKRRTLLSLLGLGAAAPAVAQTPWPQPGKQRVVFQVSEASAHREVGGHRVYFCCEKCAMYFDEHAAGVAAARGLPAPR